ncbi:protein of unknown function [Methylocella tundrae]|uniref:Uncharacterized protein n=1 Tax=Methylocella tundrae TaxID=227605 RepID=A0A4U8Z1E7_METTU|nr:protein of unknown function [Methylocella tundrae]
MLPATAGKAKPTKAHRTEALNLFISLSLLHVLLAQVQQTAYDQNLGPSIRVDSKVPKIIRRAQTSR